MEPFIGQIQPFAFDFAPRGWAKCDGQLLAIAENSALFSLIGTIYGGDGRTNFALPDLRSRSPMHTGQGNGLSLRNIGAAGGAEQITLNVSQMPAHSHAAQLRSSDQTANNEKPFDALLAGTEGSPTYHATPANTNMAPDAITVSNTGGSQPHENMAPFLTVNYCIAIVGTFPSRS